MPFADYLPRLAPPWLSGPLGELYWQKVGAVFDQVRDRLVSAIKARFPQYAADDALTQIGLDRILPRTGSETSAAYALRLINAWTAWGGDNTPLTGAGGGAGSHLAMLNNLALLGLPTGTTGMTIVQQNGRYSQLVSSALTYGTLMACVNRANPLGTVPGNLAGWTFEGRDTFYSEFGLVFPVDVPSLTAGSSLASQMNAIVKKWKPGKGVYVGCWILQSGKTLGWPTGRTCGTDPNLGTNVIRYIPPAGGNLIGYSQ